jgi:hypothetical protein
MMHGTNKVTLVDNTCEAGEQSGSIRRGVGGGGRQDQEECGTAKHGSERRVGWSCHRRIPEGEAKADALALGEAVADKNRCIQPERELAGRCVADALARLRQVKTIAAVGYLAASLVLATFCMKSINALRLAAIASNVAFIAYGYVLFLHARLLPINVCRLFDM